MPQTPTASIEPHATARRIPHLPHPNHKETDVASINKGCVMEESLEKPSIHSLPPLERGGENARAGFEVQDHVAARYLIALLEIPSLLEVWCETHDDITLIWQTNASQEVEFVQVKSNVLDQLWSISLIAAQDKKDKKTVPASSIFERSLANDRCCEPCRFRLVTCLPPNSDLEVLCLPFEAPDRQSNADALATVANALDKRTGNFRSMNGNGAHFWLSHVTWEVQQSSDALINESKIRLLGLLATRGQVFFPDQLDELYLRILTRAREAALAKWGTSPSLKKISKTCMSSWLDIYLDARKSHSTTSGEKLKEKLAYAGITDGDILASQESRRRYLQERFSPQYLKVSDMSFLGDEISAELQTLRAKLDSGEIADDGISFHAECLKTIDRLRAQHTTLKPPLSILQGCMYDITDRCLHRFRRASV